MREVPISTGFLAFFTIGSKAVALGNPLRYFASVFNGSYWLAMSKRDKDATWRSTHTLCREHDWSRPRLIHELQNGLRYRTIPPGYTIDWRDPYVQERLDIQASQLTKIVLGPRVPPILASDQVNVGIEVLPPSDASAVVTPVKRWGKRPPADVLKPAALAVAKGYQPNEPPTAATWKVALEERLGRPVTRKCARDAQRRFAPQLLRQRGQKRNRRS